MFFFLSKVLWLVAAPSNLFFGLTFVGVLLAAVSAGRLRRVAIGLAVTGVLALAVLGYSPLGSVLMRTLEDRFPQPDLSHVEPAGIIVLGGAIDQNMGYARHTIHIAEGAERLTKGMELARRFPKADLIYTGGSNVLFGDNSRSEAEDAKTLWTSLGIEPDRIKTEDRSRNTYENAVFTRDLVHPQPGQVFLLVTSAFHMPRSVALFRKAGFDIVPVPVDYQTLGNSADHRMRAELGEGLHLVNVAVRDWIGLVAYRFTGKTDVLFPAP